MADSSYGLCLLGDDNGGRREVNGLSRSECERLGGEFRGGPDTVDSLVRDVAEWKAAGHPSAEIRFRAERKYGRELYNRYLESVADLAEVNTHGHKSQRRGVPQTSVRAQTPGVLPSPRSLPPRASASPMNPVVEAAMRRRGLID